MKKDFPHFWKKNGVNLLMGLAITLLICGFIGKQGIFMSLPLWLALGIACWLARMGLLYRSWRRDNRTEDQDQDLEQP